MAGPVATCRCRGPSAAAGASGKFSCPTGALSQWRDQAVLGVYQGGAAQTLYGRKRLVIVLEEEDLGEHWGPRCDTCCIGKVDAVETWNIRWAAEIFHEFGKQVTGLEAAQVRKEEAGQAPLPLELRSAVVAPAGTGFRVDNGKVCVRTGRQHHRTAGPDDSARHVLKNLLTLVEQLLAQGHSCGAHLGGVNASVIRHHKSA